MGLAGSMDAQKSRQTGLYTLSSSLSLIDYWSWQTAGDAPHRLQQLMLHRLQLQETDLL